MSRRKYVIIVFAVAILATAIGCWETVLHKTTSPIEAAIWTPLIVITRDYGNPSMILLAAVQFPLLATIFAIAIRRLSAKWSFVIVGLIYVALACCALWIVKR